MPGQVQDGNAHSLIRPTMPELDSVRGIAVLLVLFFHGFNFGDGGTALPRLARAFVTLTLTGWMGVNLFFVLSGFLITGILLDSKAKPRYCRTFYLRRALRILPAYYAVLLLLCLLPRMGLLWHRKIDWPFIGLSFFYLANVVSLFGVRSQYTVLWSIAVEEQFYIVWPAVVRTLSRRGVAFCAVLLIVGCPILRDVAYRLGHYSMGYPWLIADGLACGALLAVLSRDVLAAPAAMQMFSVAFMSAGAGLLILGVPFGILHSWTLSGVTLRLTGLNLFFTGALGVTLLVGTSRFKWLVDRPVLRFFGKISYGLYLIHVLVFDFVDHLIARYFPEERSLIPRHFGIMLLRFGVTSGIAVALAWFSRIYFEEYFLGLKARWSGHNGKI